MRGLDFGSRDPEARAPALQTRLTAGGGEGGGGLALARRAFLPEAGGGARPLRTGVAGPRGRRWERGRAGGRRWARPAGIPADFLPPRTPAQPEEARHDERGRRRVHGLARQVAPREEAAALRE